MLLALNIHLFKVENIFVAFLRLSHRAFWPKRFYCYLALFSATQNIFLCRFTLLFFSFWRDASARDLRYSRHGPCDPRYRFSILPRFSQQRNWAPRAEETWGIPRRTV